jgi:hypothetical protein
MSSMSHDLEVKAPGIVHASLPKVAGFVVFFRVERRVMQVREQQLRLLIEGLLDGFRRLEIAPPRNASSSPESFLRAFMFLLAHPGRFRA